jgi:hypothetical protein
MNIINEKIQNCNGILRVLVNSIVHVCDIPFRNQVYRPSSNHQAKLHTFDKGCLIL